MVSRGRVVISAAFAGLFAMLFGFVYFASLDNPQLEKAQLNLNDVKVLDVNTIDKRAKLEVIFLVTNPSEKIITVSSIHYKLFVNGKNVGNGEYSVEDVSLPGRALIVSGQQVPLSTTFHLIYTNQIAEEYSAITNGTKVNYTVKGTTTIKSAWSEVDKEFETSLG